MKKIIMMLVGVGMTLNSAVATPAVSDISARQRYPWNGLVDLKFTITGESGMKYDTSFTAKDMVGGTNVAMKTIRKSDGTTAAEKEKLLPGTYNWIWDAAADLPKDFVCERVVVTGTAQEVDLHDKVQLWEGGPYWATTNIGAKEPWEAGYYFWWGDTVGYKWENEKWVASDGSNSNFSFSSSDTPTCNKIVTNLQREGWITGDGVLTQEHDAAHVHWCGDWRMPTSRELDDLNNNCDWTWTTQNGVNGYVVRGRGEYASNSIFLPCAGSGFGPSLDWYGSLGEYWSSVPDLDDNNSWYLYLLQSTVHGTSYYSSRCFGLPVRPLQGFTK